MGAGHPGRTRSRTLRPRDRGTVGLRRIGGREHERALVVEATKLSKPLHGSRKRELRAAETFDEVPAATEPDRLHRPELTVDRTEPTDDTLAAHTVTGDDALALEEELRERSAGRQARRTVASRATNDPPWRSASQPGNARIVAAAVRAAERRTDDSPEAVPTRRS